MLKLLKWQVLLDSDKTRNEINLILNLANASIKGITKAEIKLKK